MKGVTSCEKKLRNRLIALFLAIILPLSACNGGGTVPPGSTRPSNSPTSARTLSATSTLTLSPPTPTAVPMAAMVNSEGIPLADYQAELGRYQAALTTTNQAAPSDADQKKIVLDDLIDTLLLAQAATQAGFSVTQAALQTRVDQLAVNLSGEDGLAGWEKQNGYTDQSFRESLSLSIAAAWQRDQIISKVPTTADQVHAFQILVSSSTLAQTIYQQLQNGVKFATLSFYYESNTGGDLGWFPRGYLTVPEVEDAAFALQPGEYSKVIQSKLGYHIIEVVERDPNHPLSADARQTLQQQALQKWVDDQRTKSKITILIP